MVHKIRVPFWYPSIPGAILFYNSKGVHNFENNPSVQTLQWCLPGLILFKAFHCPKAQGGLKKPKAKHTGEHFSAKCLRGVFT